MFVSEVYLWGAAIVAGLELIATIVLAFLDRKMLRRMLTIFGVTVAQMVVVGRCVVHEDALEAVPGLGHNRLKAALHVGRYLIDGNDE